MTTIDTGDSALDMALECGPRMFGPDTPERVRREIAGSSSLHWYKMHLAAAAISERERLKAEIRQIGRENREIEFKATNGLGIPYCRIPTGAIELGKQLIGPDWWRDEKELEAFLEAYPECRITVTRGTRGQEYAGKGRS